MIWIALAVMIAISWWNTHRYLTYLENVESAVKRYINRFEKELEGYEKDLQQALKYDQQIIEVRNKTFDLELHLRALLDRPENRADEVSQAAINDLLRK